MRILIISLPLHVNYGGILQAYALQTALEDMGHTVKVLDWPTYANTPSHKWMTYTRRFIGNIMHNSKSEIKWEENQNKRIAIERKFTQPFINYHINRYIVSTPSEIDCTQFDAIIVGSDQVWRPKYFCTLWNSKIREAFLKFTDNFNLKRIAYAASFGTDKWEIESKDTIICKQLLAKFDTVSVREVSGVHLCRKFLSRPDVERMPDPTILIEKNRYISSFNINNIAPSNGKFMSYILDENEYSNKIISSLNKNSGLKHFKANSEVENESADLSNRIQPPVERWLRGFLDADLIVTDSFHAAVFSILFNKAFYVITNNERGNSRIDSLLSIFNLSNCSISDGRIPSFIPDIDWSNVNNIIERERKSGLNFLSKSLK